MRLLVCDPTESSAVEAMREAGIDVDVMDAITQEELANVIGSCEAVVVRSRTRARAPLIDKATDLKLIIRGGVGVDSIDADYAQSKGIVVRNTPLPPPTPWRN